MEGAAAQSEGRSEGKPQVSPKGCWSLQRLGLNEAEQENKMARADQNARGRAHGGRGRPREPSCAQTQATVFQQGEARGLHSGRESRTRGLCAGRARERGEGRSAPSQGAGLRGRGHRQESM